MRLLLYCFKFRARVTYPNGDTYEGSFNEDRLKDGPGVYTWSLEEGANPWLPEGGLPEGRVVKYEGSWSNGLRSGIGKIFYPNGDRYHGARPTAGGLPSHPVPFTSYSALFICCCRFVEWWQAQW